MAGALIDARLDDFLLDRDLLDRIRRARNMRPAWDETGEMLVSSSLGYFEREEDPEGNPWKKSARAEAEGGQTLSDTGILKGSLTHEADDDGVAWGSNEVQAAIHQLGGIIEPVAGEYLVFKVGGQWVMTRRVVMPPRAFLGISGLDEARIRSIFARHLGVSL